MPNMSNAQLPRKKEEFHYIIVAMTSNAHNSENIPGGIP